jgi:arginine decarboxylase
MKHEKNSTGSPDTVARTRGAWSVADSRALYHVDAWGQGYFGVNDLGHVVVRPEQDPERSIDLYDVVQGLKARDLTAPVVVRFPGVLAHRLRQLNDAFVRAIAENEYQNRYAAVIPSRSINSDSSSKKFSVTAASSASGSKPAASRNYSPSWL